MPVNESDRFWVSRGDEEHVIQGGEIFHLPRMYSLIGETRYAFRVKAQGLNQNPTRTSSFKNSIINVAISDLTDLVPSSFLHVG